MQGVASFGSMAGDSIQQAGALLGGNDSPNWAGNIGGGVAKGAAAGAMLGPIGAGIGAGIGAIGGAVKSLTEKKAMEEQRNAQIRQRNAHMAANLPAQPMYTPTFAMGGGIHIDPSKRGTFTAAATKHGKGVQEFARQVLANKDNYSPAMVKKANFARNASKWHAEGGPLTDTIPNNHLNAMYSGVENYLRSQRPSADTIGLSNRFQQSNGVMSTFKEEPINPIDTMSTQTLQQFLPFFRNKVDSLEQNQYYTPQYNPAPTPNKPKLQPIAKAFGGNLDNTTLYETGGTHQSNPMGGIPIGQNALVEEGEVRFDTDGGESYIFSNKIPFKKQ